MSKSLDLYVPIDNSKSQYRRLVFRNNSLTDIVVKLVVSKPHVVELARDRLRLLPSGSLFIEIKIDSARIGTFDYQSPKISGYAMPVYAHTLPKIAKWLNTPGMETKKQLAFELEVKFNNNVFSARDTIIDLPGSACLVEAVPKSIPLIKNDSPVDTVDVDTTTAVMLNSQEDVIKFGRVEAEKNESCWFTEMLSSNYNPMSGITNEESRRDVPPKTLSSDFTNRASSITAVERLGNFVNVEQDATPCGGS
ncbi:hypothetical protein RB195_018488 [Necator americanus]|uniref:Major sperm protein n=1 Tax=Necator americanus TaxID=51031 RepID=A0ABR1CA12_NECAM